VTGRASTAELAGRIRPGSAPGVLG